MSPIPQSGVVVIVEDPFIRGYLRSVLTRAGYRTVEAGTQAALDFLRTGEVPVKALVTNRPAAFLPVAAHVPVIYTTSCPETDAVQGFECWRVLRKPFQAAELLATLKEICEVVVL